MAVAEATSSTGSPQPTASSRKVRARQLSREAGPFLLVLVLLPLVPIVMTSQTLLYLAVTAVISAGLGYTFDAIYSTVGLLPMSQALAWGSGAYAGALLSIHTDLPYLVCAFGGGLAGALVNGLVVLPALRLKGSYYLILTFAAAELGVVVVTNLDLDVLGGPSGLVVTEPASVFGHTFATTEDLLFLAGGLLLSVMLAVTLLKASRMGRAMLAVKQNDSLARSLGLRPWKYFILAFALSGFMAGWLGLVYANLSLILAPGLFGAWTSVQVALMLLVGGSGTRLGPLVGAVVITFTPHALGLSPTATQIVYGAGLVVLMLFLPRGLVGGIASAVAAMMTRRVKHP